MNERKVVTMELNTEQQDGLRAIAKKHGYTLPSGPRYGDGNIKQFLLAILAGDLRVISANGST